MLLGNGKQAFVAEQRRIVYARQRLRVVRDDQIERLARQPRQQIEVLAAGNIDFHLRPVVAEMVDRRHQPLEAAVALDRHVQATLFVAGQPCQIAFRQTQLGQHLFGQGQQPFPGAGERHRTRLAGKQRHAEPRLEILDLVR